MTKSKGAPLGSQNAVVHGGEGALKRIADGREFIGLALETYESVIAETGVNPDEISGIEGILLKRAARFETAARLFEAAADSAAAAGDFVRWERMTQRSGWIGGKSYDSFKNLRHVLADRPHTVDYEELIADEQDD